MSRYLNKAEEDLVNKLGQCLLDHEGLSGVTENEKRQFTKAVGLAQRQVLQRPRRPYTGRQTVAR